ncbi:MAG: acyltransferase [Pseudomonadota bacterium]
MSICESAVEPLSDAIAGSGDTKILRRVFSVRSLPLGIRNDRYLIELECLRGVAVVLVFVFHCWGIMGGKEARPGGVFEVIAATGNTGVTLFFVLSGFLLAQPWLRYYFGMTNQTPSLRRYIAARSLRILPLYYAVIGFAAFHLDSSSLLLPAATFQMLGFQYFPYSTVWWTLITEVQFYLALPICGFLLIYSRMTRILLASLLALWLICFLIFVIGPKEPIEGFMLTKSLFSRAPAFLFGIVIGALYLNNTAQTFLTTKRRTLTLAVALTALYYLLYLISRTSSRETETLWPTLHLWEGLCWALATFAIANGRDAFRWLRVLERPLAFLGKISYSIYLLHVPILFYLIYPATSKNTASTVLVLLALAGAVLTVLASTVTYLLIERPALQLKGTLGT